jgi:hypothetical protein
MVPLPAIGSTRKRTGVARTGRPSKKVPETVAAICAALRAGADRRSAAAFAKIHRDTFYAWLRDDDFLTAVLRAEAGWEIAMVAVIEAACEAGKWRACAWLLERRNPQDYGPIRPRRMRRPKHLPPRATCF